MRVLSQLGHLPIWPLQTFLFARVRFLFRERRFDRIEEITGKILLQLLQKKAVAWQVADADTN